MPLVTLLLIQGADQGQRYEFTQEEVTIGRGATNDIRLHDTESSRSHAFLRWVETDGWRIIDEGSSNGTYVNGTITRKRTLKDGDQIQIGRTILVCHFSRTKRTAADRVQLMGPEHPADQSRIVSQSPGDAADGIEHPCAESDFEKIAAVHNPQRQRECSHYQGSDSETED